ncbi:acyltransferase family protein [Novosphingobium album (ex Hu et al. 2023)]|uniref:Acyltransferase n=1 Tax=Novosphingobium album (ex Hu et al. 2023) TaxID=2930093 RepID=A0ABT0AVY9_9SPHN|nr:acyltransferase [Novosphingobium album (ex Hu et al. 2023)]MCJ2176977.1 acyltransferase [Novosphingobium album (ex Hu et al. 2023)]
MHRTTASRGTVARGTAAAVANAKTGSLAAGHSVAPSGYRPQLDGLRALACLGVLYSHLWVEESMLGHAGVRLFFTLSGYLITLILLDDADKRALGLPRQPLWHFYARRALRLWPAYYAALAIALITNVHDLRDSATWHILYATNIYFAVTNNWWPQVIVSWWSLSVEEQFYLVWPILLLAVPRRWQAASAIAFCLGGLMLRALFPSDSVAYYTLPFASLDSLTGGALLAMAEHRGRLSKWFPLIALPVLALQLWAWELPPALATQCYETSFAVVFTCIVAVLSRGYAGPLNWIFGSPLARYLGKISYGIYLYHMFVRVLLQEFSYPLAPSLMTVGFHMFAVGTLLTVALASLSWYVLEAPMNRLKRHVSYP